MTLTRTYYNLLIELMSALCSVRPDDPLTFSDIKKDLSNAINRIEKFNLIPFTFSKDFFTILHERTKSDFTDNKLVLINDLNFELHECLYTTRLRFGGELMYYLFELKIALFQLPINQLSEIGKVLRKPSYYNLGTNFVFRTEDDKLKVLKLLKAEQKSRIVKKAKVVLKEKNCELIEKKLKKNISEYQSYIASNYPTIANSFSFYGKKIRAYLTEALSSKVFEFRIHAYASNSKNSSVTVLRKYYDFYPAYFYNLEEISDTQTGAMVTGLSKTDLTFTNTLTQEYIFRELTNIYLENANEKDISLLTEFLLKCNFYKISKVPENIGLEFDLFAEKENKKCLFEIYHHKVRSLDKIFERIRHIKTISSDYKISFVFSSYPGEIIISQLTKNNILPTYISDLVSNLTAVNNKEVVEWYIKDKLQNLKQAPKLTKRFEGETLLTRLSNCPSGEKNWSQYESIGIDIFRFLFEDSFRSYIAEEQVENDLKNHRRDLIVSNYFKDATSFWAEAKQLYQSKAIIVDFKNYSEKLNSNTLFNTSKYNTKKVGFFALVFSRAGIDKTAVIEQKELFSQGKLLIEFNDAEIREMIQEKIIGKDPLDRLKSKEFEIITS